MGVFSGRRVNLLVFTRERDNGQENVNYDVIGSGIGLQ